MTIYDAFISYSHSKDKPIAAALQSAIQKLGKPWYKRRALRVFRDDTSLSATPHLWATIEQALGQSRYFILLASPEAAASKWVNREVAYWLNHNSIGALLIAVTNGALSWDGAANDFAWRDDAPLPPVLKGQFATEPKWIDLTAYRDGADNRDAKFTELAANFAAAIRGIPKEDLLSQEVRQQRRALTLAWSAAVSLAILVALASWQWNKATNSERLATKQRDRAVQAEHTAIEQKALAESQRDRAEKTLEMAALAANSFVLDLAVPLRERAGVPAQVAREVLSYGLKLQKTLMAVGLTSSELKRSEAVALGELAEILVAQGDTQEALDAANNSSMIFQVLARKKPDDNERQRDLMIAYGKVGRVLRQLNHENALAAFGKSIEIAERLVASDTTNEKWKGDLSTGHIELGLTLQALGQYEKALEAFRKGLTIREEIAAARPKKEIFYPLAEPHHHIGEVLFELGRHGDALASYRQSAAINESMVTLEPDIPRWQKALIFDYGGIGDASLALHNRPEALEAYRQALVLSENLATSRPETLDFQRVLLVSYTKVANAFLSVERWSDAVSFLEKGRVVAEKLAASNEPQARVEFAEICGSLGGALLRADRDEEAADNLTHALAILKELDDSDQLSESGKLKIYTIQRELAAALRKQATRGDADAQYKLGIMYGNGDGIEQDYGEAIKWLRLASEQNHIRAQYKIGVIYNQGAGVHSDYGEALKWFRRAAEQGEPNAQFNLGLMYSNGRGVPQDYGEAVKWTKLAAQQGHGRAQNVMGLMYAEGQGVSQDFSEAVHWFRRGADQGDGSAQFNLGLRYTRGEGVEQDHASAYMWFALAAIHFSSDDPRHDRAAKYQDMAAGNLTSAQIIKVLKAVREWKPTKR